MKSIATLIGLVRGITPLFASAVIAGFTPTHGSAATIVAEPGEAGFRAAIAAALDGDTITIRHVVELQSSVRIDKSVTIRTDDSYPGLTGISGRFEGEVLVIAAANVVLEKVRITGSPQTDGLRLLNDILLRDASIDSCRSPVVDDFWPSPYTVRLQRVEVFRNEQPLNCHNLEAEDSSFSFSKSLGASAYDGKLVRCLFERNLGDGLILTYGTVKDCVFRFNADLGLRFDPDPGALNLSGSLFYDNAGGGLLLREEAVATVDNCTFTRHTGAPAISVSEANQVLFRHCTVVDNVVLGGGQPGTWPSYPVGAAFALISAVRVELQNCLVADNPATGGAHASGLIGDYVDGGGNVIGGPARVSELRDNGGPTFSLLPQADSPAIDAARPSDLITDARGLSRAAGAAPDAGAIERDAGPVADSDADGVPDLWEVLYHLNPTNANDVSSDPDNDGQTTLAEFQARTDPTDATSVHRIAPLLVVPPPLLQPDDRTIYLTWPVSPGVNYVVERSTDLRTWNEISVIAWPSSDDKGQPARLYEIQANGPQAFYRITARDQ